MMLVAMMVLVIMVLFTIVGCWRFCCLWCCGGGVDGVFCHFFRVLLVVLVVLAVVVFTATPTLEFSVTVCVSV